jgi:hypothetical protein
MGTREKSVVVMHIGKRVILDSEKQMCRLGAHGKNIIMKK